MSLEYLGQGRVSRGQCQGANRSNEYLNTLLWVEDNLVIIVIIITLLASKVMKEGIVFVRV